MIRKVFIELLAREKDTGRMIPFGDDVRIISGSSESDCESSARRQLVTENRHQFFRLRGSVPFIQQEVPDVIRKHRERIGAELQPWDDIDTHGRHSV